MEFAASQALSLGIELELQLVRAHDRAGACELLRAISTKLRGHGGI